MPHDPVELGGEVLRACAALGFALAGITPASASARESELRRWLAAGKHGEMAWMEELLEERLDITRMLPGARSVIMVADLYQMTGEGAAGTEPAGGRGGQGKVARYARGRDYHTVIKRRLHRLADRLRARFPGEEFRSFVDSGPVMEREQAWRAGMGWIGKHTLLINPRLGSYLLLGGLATTLELREVSDATGPRAVPDHCGTCTRCIDACPTGAIEPYSVDARKCISYLTIEHASPIEPALEEQMEGWVFGCDICQEVCPFNAVEPAAPPHRAYAPARAGLGLAGVLACDKDGYQREVSGSAMKRASLDMLKRNAAIAGGESLSHGKNHEILAALRGAASDEEATEVVRSAAARALERAAQAPDGPAPEWKTPCKEGGERGSEQKT